MSLLLADGAAFTCAGIMLKCCLPHYGNFDCGDCGQSFHCEVISKEPVPSGSFHSTFYFSVSSIADFFGHASLETVFPGRHATTSLFSQLLTPLEQISA